MTELQAIAFGLGVIVGLFFGIQVALNVIRKPTPSSSVSAATSRDCPHYWQWSKSPLGWVCQYCQKHQGVSLSTPAADGGRE